MIAGIASAPTVLLACMKRKQVAQGPHLKPAFDVERRLSEFGRRLPINYAAVVAAVPLDMGFTSRECYMFVQPSFMAGIPPCYMEAAEHPEGATFAIRYTRVRYDGPERQRSD